jgi:hypothetical protein
VSAATGSSWTVRSRRLRLAWIGAGGRGEPTVIVADPPWWHRPADGGRSQIRVVGRTSPRAEGSKMAGAPGTGRDGVERVSHGRPRRRSARSVLRDPVGVPWPPVRHDVVGSPSSGGGGADDLARAAALTRDCGRARAFGSAPAAPRCRADEETPTRVRGGHVGSRLPVPDGREEAKHAWLPTRTPRGVRPFDRATPVTGAMPSDVNARGGAMASWWHLRGERADVRSWLVERRLCAVAG